jgi:nucleolar complex protein 2
MSPDEGNAHLMELSKLAEKDPEFYKYLQENDRELLDFDASALPEADDEDMIDPEAETGERAPPLTMAILRQWQKALLEVGSTCIPQRLN